MSKAKEIDGNVLTPLEWQALARVGAQAKASRPECPVGKAQPVDVLVRIQGYLDVSPDGEYVRSSKPSVEDVLALVLSNLDGKERPKMIQVLQSLDVSTAGEADRKVAKELIRSRTKHTTGTRAGRTAGAFTVGRVELGGLTVKEKTHLAKSTRAISFED